MDEAMRKHLDRQAVAHIAAQDSVRPGAKQEVHLPDSGLDAIRNEYRRLESDLQGCSVSLAEMDHTWTLSWHPVQGLRILVADVQVYHWQTAPSMLLVQALPLVRRLRASKHVREGKHGARLMSLATAVEVETKAPMLEEPAPAPQEPGPHAIPALLPPTLAPTKAEVDERMKAALTPTRRGKRKA